MPGKRKASPRASRGCLKTREVLEATGITHQILYRYITLGLIQEAETTSTGQRLFHGRTIAAIRLIQRLNQSGYTLRDIKEIFFKEGRLKVVDRPDSTVYGK
jgi:DNA-binding transcriptional MerR regulator